MIFRDEELSQLDLQTFIKNKAAEMEQNKSKKTSLISSFMSLEHMNQELSNFLFKKESLSDNRLLEYSIFSSNFYYNLEIKEEYFQKK